MGTHGPDLLCLAPHWCVHRPGPMVLTLLHCSGEQRSQNGMLRLSQGAKECAPPALQSRAQATLSHSLSSGLTHTVNTEPRPWKRLRQRHSVTDFALDSSQWDQQGSHKPSPNAGQSLWLWFSYLQAAAKRLWPAASCPRKYGPVT